MLGEILSNYRIEQRLGAGGMGEVYLGRHQHIERLAAIKLLLRQHSENPVIIQRFFTEARATSRIRHPGIVEILDCGVHPDGRAYIVMEYLVGESLRQALSERDRLPSNLRDVLLLVAQMARAIGAAHQLGIVHRDLKPDNIFLVTQPDGPPQPKILDFGIAKLMDAEQGAISTTKTGALLGTPLYMSPEQCQGISAGIDARTDIYSLGCILYEMVCGRPPFVDEGLGALMMKHMTAQPPAPRLLNPAVPAALADLMMNCLAKAPQDRPDVTTLVQRLVTMELPAGSLLEAAPAELARPAGPHGTLVLPPERETARPELSGAPPTPTTMAGTAGEWVAGQPLPSPRRWWVWGTGGGVAAALGLFWALRGPAPARVTEGGQRPAPVYPATPVPVTPPLVAIQIDKAPPGLTVQADGSARALPLRIPRDGKTHTLVFAAPGFAPRSLVISADHDHRLVLDLQPLPGPTVDTGAAPSPSKPHRPRKPKRDSFGGFTDL